MISGLNLSILAKTFLSNVSIKLLPLVSAVIGALKIFPTPVSFSDPVPGNNGNS
jgi:hypothetical protein